MTPKKQTILLISIIMAAIGALLWWLWRLLFGHGFVEEIQLQNTTIMKVKDISRQLPREGSWPSRLTSKITDITLHHTAAPASQTPYQIASYHVAHKEWPGIGYHFLVYQDGAVFQVNPISAYSFHNGYNNKIAIGVTMVGNFEENLPPAVQIESAIALVKQLNLQYPNIKYLVGHREYKNGSLCPGKFVSLDHFRQQTGLGINPTAKGKFDTAALVQKFADV